MKKQVNVTVVVLGIISVLEMAITHGSMDSAILLWLLYGLYKFLTQVADV